MRGAPHKGLAWLMRRIRSRMFAATSCLPGRRRDFLVQCQAKARRCQRRTVSGRTISRHRRQPDQHRYNTTHKSRSQRWRGKRRGAFLWKTASWWRSARISACKAARVRKVEAIKAKKATKRELIVVATMISRLIGTPLISDRTEFSVTTRVGRRFIQVMLAFRDNLAECLSALRAHKLRACLTMLGLTIGVATLITVMTIVQGANLYVESKVANLGTNVF